MDMRMLERARMAMMAHPDTPQPASFIEGIVYPAFQEPATEVSHRNTMQRLPVGLHKIGRQALAAVSGDEKKHALFYTELTTSALQVDASSTIIAIARQVRDFAMPGKSIPGFKEHAEIIERAGIFGAPQLLAIYEERIDDTWDIWNRSGLSDDAERARDYLKNYLSKMHRVIEWAARKREEKPAT